MSVKVNHSGSIVPVTAATSATYGDGDKVTLAGKFRYSPFGQGPGPFLDLSAPIHIKTDDGTVAVREISLEQLPPERWPPKSKDGTQVTLTGILTYETAYTGEGSMDDRSNWWSFAALQPE